MSASNEELKGLFDSWRKDKSTAEKAYLDSAHLLNDYLKGVAGIPVIQTELANANSPQFKALDKHAKRTLGAIVLCKLQIDKTLNGMTDKESTEAQLLKGLGDILTKGYDDPKSLTGNLEILFKNANQLLAMPAEDYEDKQQTQALCTTLFTMLQILNVTLGTLGRFQKMAVAATGVNLAEINTNIAVMLQKTAEKIKELDGPVQQKADSTQPKQKSTQELYNQRFLQIVSQNQQSPKETSQALLTEMKASTADLTSVIDGHEERSAKKQKTTEQRQQVAELLSAFVENDKQENRAYFTDLIKKYPEAYQLVLAQSTDQKKDILPKDPNQQPEASWVASGQYAVSLASSWLVNPWRKLAPQAAQDFVLSYAPDTKDSENKRVLQELARNCVADLDKQLATIAANEQETFNKVANGDPELARKLAAEPIENLQALRDNNIAVQKVLEDYTQLYTEIEGSSASIDELIDKNNGPLVKISNFFAKFADIFKSNSAQIIDNLQEIKAQLKELEGTLNKNKTPEELVKSKAGLADDTKAKLQSLKDGGSKKETVKLTSELAQDLKEQLNNAKQEGAVEATPSETIKPSAGG